MSDLLLLTPTLEPAPAILPSLGLLLHTVRVAPATGLTGDSPRACLVRRCRCVPLTKGRRSRPFRGNGPRWLSVPLHR